MKTGRRTGILASVVAIVLVVFFLVPLVPYSVAVSIPSNIFGKPYNTCVPILDKWNSRGYNETAMAQYRECLTQNAYPPSSMTGYAPLSYRLLGIGSPPYPSYALISQGWKSSLAFFHGPRLSYVLGSSTSLGSPGFLFSNHTALNPGGIIDVEDARLWPAGIGLLNFTVLIRNVGQSDIYIPQVGFIYPGYGSNRTYGGVTWLSPVGGLWGCSSPVVGFGYLAPGHSCEAYYMVDTNPALQAGSNYTLTVVVSGGYYQSPPTYTLSGTQTVITTTFAPYSGTLTDFVVVKSFSVQYPGTGPNAQWMGAFMQLVNGQRGGIPLAEDPALDSFAQARFETASSVYQISDYGFDNQSASYFNGTGKISTEEILFPSYYSPSAFVGVLQKDAPGHWDGLLNTAYTHYGYYVGDAPSVEFSVSCPVTEITQRNVNITQVAIQNGCSYKVDTVTWLLIVLSS